jgi:transposase
MVFIRKIKNKSGTYLAEVESYRENGKIKQRLIKYLGKDVNGVPVKKINSSNIIARNVKKSLDIQAIHKCAIDLGLLEKIENKHILALCYSHLLGARSINKLSDWINFTEIPEILNLKNLSTTSFYNAICLINDLDFTQIENYMLDRFKSFYPSDKTLIIDVTDTYFEGKKASNSKSRKGKDGKIKPLKQFALAVTKEKGFPVFHKQYSGNLSDVDIFKDMSLELKNKGYDSIYIDRGLSSFEGLKILNSNNYKIICGLRKTEKTKKDFIIKKSIKDIYNRKFRVELKNTVVYIKSFDYLEGKLIVIFNPIIEFQKKEKAYSNDEDYDETKGYSLIYHTTNFEAKDVVKKYFEKDIIERAFKQMKGIINLRPIRVWLNKNVEGHFKICYLSYAILSYLNFLGEKKNISGIDILERLSTCYKINLYDNINNVDFNVLVQLEPKQKEVVKLLKL